MRRKRAAPSLHRLHCRFDLGGSAGHTFSEVGRPDRVLTSVVLRFSLADAPRIREALTSAYQQEGQPIVEGDTGRITSGRRWSGLTTSATYWEPQTRVGTTYPQVTVGSREY